MSSLSDLAIAGRIATLTLRRAEARNSLSLELLASLHEHIDALAAARDAAASVTVLIITGEGKAFCAGMDLKAVATDAGLAAGLPLQLLSSLASLCVKIRSLPMVTLAKVNGAAIGGGCGLATVCDLAFTHADSKMGFPEVDLGVCPAVVAPWLVRKVGAGRARQILLSGGILTGQQAHAMGIVDHVVPGREELDAAVDKAAQRLATGGPQALRATKDLLNELDGSLDGEQAQRGAALSAHVLSQPEAQAMLRAKLQG
jgi:methylglutaconyl-CoA hydratase